jgi:hypothetical protein
VQWIYAQKVDMRKLKEEAAGQIKTQILVFVWALVERLQIPLLRDFEMLSFEDFKHPEHVVSQLQHCQCMLTLFSKNLGIPYPVNLTDKLCQEFRQQPG